MNSISTDFKTQNQPNVSDSQSFKTWLTNVSRVVKPHEGLCAFLDMAVSVNTVLGNSQKGKVALEHTLTVLSLVGLVGDLEWWICQEASSKQEKISQFLFTALKCVRVFLEFVNFAPSRAPLIDLILSILNIGGLTFSLWHNKNEYEKMKNEKYSNLTDAHTWERINQNDLAKNWMAVALDVANVTASALALVASFTNISEYPLVKAGTIFLGTGTSGFWFYKCYYEVKNQDVQNCNSRESYVS